MNKLKIQILVLFLSSIGLLISIVIPAFLTAGDVYEAVLKIRKLQESIELRIASFGLEFAILMLVVHAEQVLKEVNNFRYYFDKIIALTLTVMVALVNSIYLYTLGMGMDFSFFVSILVGAGFPFAIYALSEKFSSVLRNFLAKVKEYYEMIQKENELIATLNGQIADIVTLKSNYDTLLEHRNELQAALHLLSKSGEIYAEKIAAQAKEISTLAENKKLLDNEISTLAKAKELLSNEISTLAKAKELLSNEISTQAKAKELLSNEISTQAKAKELLSNEISTQAKAKELLDTEIEALEKNKSSLQSQSKQASEIAELNRKLAKALNELEASTNDLEVLKKAKSKADISFNIGEDNWKRLFNLTKNIDKYVREKNEDKVKKMESELIQFLPTICKIDFSCAQ